MQRNREWVPERCNKEGRKFSVRVKMDTNAGGEEEEAAAALGAATSDAVENGAAAASPVNNGDIVVGLEKIPRCSMQG